MLKKLNLFKAVFFTGIVILPLVYFPKADIPFEIPKVIFFQRWTEILAILSIGSLKNIFRKKIDQKLFFSFIIYIVFAIFASASGVDPLKSLFGNFFRRDGLITLFHFILLYFVVLANWKDDWEDMLVSAVVCGSIIVSIHAICLAIQYYYFHNLSAAPFRTGIGSLFGQPNFFGGYLLVTIPFLFHKLQSSKRKYIWLGAICIQFIALLLSQSRGAIFGFLIFIVLLVMFSNIRYFSKRTILLVLSITGVLVMLTLYTANKKQLFKVDGPWPESRVRVITRGLLAFVKKPILGWGYANFDYAFESVDWPYKFKHDVYYDKAHSHLLENLVTLGIFGFLSYIYLIMLLLRNLYKKSMAGNTEKNSFYKTLFIVLLLYLFHTQTNVISINEELYFYLILGISTQAAIVK